MNDRSSLRILVACEFSGTVRNAFLAEGYDAWSCDLLPAEDGSNRHIRGDARELLGDGWDLLFVAHPPCTRLCNSGVRWLDEPPTNPPEAASEQERSAWPMLGRDARVAIMWRLFDEGAALFSIFWNAPIERIAIENPVMHRHAKERIVDFRPPAQTVQPWWFGEPFFKATGLYLRNLPPLVATDRLTPPARGTAEHKAWSRVHRLPPGRDRWRERSRFFPGIAAAMAAQWGAHALSQIRRAA